MPNGYLQEATRTISGEDKCSATSHTSIVNVRHNHSRQTTPTKGGNEKPGGGNRTNIELELADPTITRKTGMERMYKGTDPHDKQVE